MKSRGLLVTVLLFALVMLGCVGSPTATPPDEVAGGAAAEGRSAGPPGAPKQLVAVIELARGGSFTIALRSDRAPKTVENFVSKARAKKYDGLTFHRVEDWVVQGGDPLGTGRGGGQMPSELNELPFKVGAVGIARGPDIRINNDSQWFVTKRDANWLDGQYTNFGQVTAGMEVVNGIRVGDVIKTIRVEER